MKVLITGGTGFIGHHLVEHILKNTDWEIVILDRIDETSTQERLTDIDIWEEEKRRVRFVYHDLKAPINYSVAKRLNDIDVCYHLAASSHVDRSITDPLSFIQDNVVGTCNILNWAKFNCGRFFNFSTDEIFGPAPDGVFFEEHAPWHPSNPYAASKCGQSALGYAFANTYGMDIITTNTMNNFGERQHPEKFIPKVIRHLINEEPVPIHCMLQGDKVLDVGSRCWLHARNTADALLSLTEHGIEGQTYNIVGSTELDNARLAAEIANILDKPLKVEYVDFHSARPGHDRRYALSGKKLDALGWKPPVSFSSALVDTVNWTLAHPEWLL